MIEITELRKLSKNLIADPDDYIRSFRENIRMYVDQKEITLADIAEKADMPESSLKSFVYGNAKDCHLSTAVKLARVFNISVDEMVGCGTISPQTCESLQIIRQLPKSFTHFVRYAMHLHYKKLTDGSISEKAIEVTEAIVHPTGGMSLTPEFSILDISNLNEDVRIRAFMGVKIPSDLYEPAYFEGETLILANDRNPRNGDIVLVSMGSCIYLFRTKMEKIGGETKRVFYSIRDGRRCETEDTAKLIIGYVVHVIAGEEE